MEAELLKIIETNLPKMAGDTLRKRLEDADKAEKRLRELESENANHRVTITQLKTDADHREKAATTLAKVEEERRKLEAATKSKEIQDTLLQCAKEKVEFAEKIVGMVFANNKYKYSVYERDSIPVVTTPSHQVGSWTPGSVVQSAEKTSHKSIDSEG